jgi:hypothetical protein
MFIVIYSNYCSVSKWTNSLQKTKQKTKKPKKLFYRFNEILLKEYALYQNYTNFLDDIDYVCSEIVGCRFCFIISIHLWKSMCFLSPQTNLCISISYLSKSINTYKPQDYDLLVITGLWLFWYTLLLYWLVLLKELKETMHSYTLQ